MKLHPQLSEIVSALRAAESANGAWREAGLDALRAAAKQAYVAPGPTVRTRTLTIPGPGGGVGAETELTLHVFEPPQSPGLNSGLIFFGAGGYVVGDMFGHAALCQQLAISVGAVIVSVEPRLAPEHKFPAAILDAYAATCWVHENADDLGIDHRRLAIGGESTGATLATAVCRLAKERRNPPLTLQLLFYPIVDLRDAALAHIAERQRAEPELGSVLSSAMLHELAALYVQHDADREDPRCSPLAAANLIGVAPALIVAAEQDLLCDQVEAYAAALRAAHVPTTCSLYAGMPHGFAHMFAQLDRGREALVEVSGALRTAFANAVQR